MTDVTPFLAAKSNQLNSDDLVGGGITVKITNVSNGNSEQPIAISYEGDNNKPWFPCKSMLRVLAALWSNQGKTWVGRSLTLYRDPSVQFGGIAVGGIRISHMSHIDKEQTVVLAANRKSKKPFIIKPLSTDKQTPKQQPAQEEAPFKVILASGEKGFQTAAEWRDWFNANAHKIPKDKLESFTQRNNPLFLEYSEQFPDEVSDVLELLSKLDEPEF